MRFKFEGNQKVWITKSGHPVTVIARTEFFNDRQPRYCVRSDTHIPGKNMNEDWINEDQLTHIAPVVETETPPVTAAVQSKPGKRPGIRKRGLATRN